MSFSSPESGGAQLTQGGKDGPSFGDTLSHYLSNRLPIASGIVNAVAGQPTQEQPSAPAVNPTAVADVPLMPLDVSAGLSNAKPPQGSGLSALLKLLI